MSNPALRLKALSVVMVVGIVCIFGLGTFLPSMAAQDPTPQPTVMTPPIPPIGKPVFGEPLITTVGDVIGPENFAHLTQVSRWGKGKLLAVAFAPDGHTVIAGSAFGFAIYDLQHPDAPPRWVDFEAPFVYQYMFFSSDGEAILLKPDSGYADVQPPVQIRSYPEGTLLDEEESAREWLGDSQWVSADEQLYFDYGVLPDEEQPEIGYVTEVIIHIQSDEPNMVLQGDTIFIEFKDRHEPEGCDIAAHSFCGNAYLPITSTPFQASFAPTNATLAVLYRPWELQEPERFGTARVYDLSDGHVLMEIGSFEQPVGSFAYAPDGNRLVVRYIDGQVQVWNIVEQTVEFERQDFAAPVLSAKYTYDSQYVVIQHPKSVEVRSARSGAFLGSYEATRYALSPVDYRLALGNKAGELRMVDITTGEQLFDIQAHDGEIYGLAFSPTGKRLASSGRDCAVRQWNAITGDFLLDFEENVTTVYDWGTTDSRIFVDYMWYIEGTEQLLGYGSWSRVVSWDVNTGATQYMIEPEPLSSYSGMIMLQDPHYPSSMSLDLDAMRFTVGENTYAIQTGEVIGTVPPPENTQNDCTGFGPFSPDGQWRITSDNAGNLCLLAAEDGVLLSRLEVLPPGLRGRELYLDWAYISPDQRQLIVDVSPGALYVFQAMP